MSRTTGSSFERAHVRAACWIIVSSSVNEVTGIRHAVLAFSSHVEDDEDARQQEWGVTARLRRDTVAVSRLLENWGTILCTNNLILSVYLFCREVVAIEVAGECLHNAESGFEFGVIAGILIIFPCCFDATVGS